MDENKTKAMQIELIGARHLLSDFDATLGKVPITVLIEREQAWMKLIESARDNYRNELKRLGYTEEQLRCIGHNAHKWKIKDFDEEKAILSKKCQSCGLEKQMNGIVCKGT